MITRKMFIQPRPQIKRRVTAPERVLRESEEEKEQSPINVPFRKISAPARSFPMVRRNGKEESDNLAALGMPASRRTLMWRLSVSSKAGSAIRFATSAAKRRRRLRSSTSSYSMESVSVIKVSENAVNIQTNNVNVVCLHFYHVNTSWKLVRVCSCHTNRRPVKATPSSVR